MTAVLEADGLGKRYGRRPALTGCDLNIPQGRVVGLVGPNGAGKSTLLQLACGLIAPTSGTIRVLGARPAADAALLPKVGFVAQDTPVYAGLSVAEHLRMGAKLNPAWDGALAQRRIEQIGLDPRQRAGRLSGGQRAQLALTIAVAKRPELLIFDEPAAALDPLARRGFLENLMEFVADLGASAILSSHLLADVERVCDYLIVLADARVQVAGTVQDLLASHYRFTGGHGDPAGLPPGVQAIAADRTPSGSALVVHADGPLPPVDWHVESIELEDLVLAYMTRGERTDRPFSSDGFGGATMIWLTWRQFRTQALAALAAVLLLGSYLVTLGLQIRSKHDSVLSQCRSHGNCPGLLASFTSQYYVQVSLLSYFLLIVPGILAMFWGVPLITRELELGTHRLVWNQSVTRKRWLLVKLGVVGLSSMAVAGLLSLLLTWAASPFDQVEADRFTPALFAARNIAPVAYAAFACALGVTLGLFIRRTLPAMALAAVLFAVVQITVPSVVRPDLVPPVRTSVQLTSSELATVNFLGQYGTVGGLKVPSGDWVVSTSPMFNSAGESIGHSAMYANCINTSVQSVTLSCLTKADLHVNVTVQPARRYWSFQWYESGLYALTAVILAGLCLWRIRGRLN